MSELKSYDLVDIQDYRGEVYIKSEADSVFVELEAENESLLQQNRELFRALQVMYGKEEYDRQKYQLCLAMAECRDAQSRWCYQAACTLPPGVTATLYGKPVMVEPKRLFRRSERLILASTLWKQRAGRFSGGGR